MKEYVQSDYILEQMNISPVTLWRWVRKGVVPAPLKIRRRHYWDEAELNAKLETLRVRRPSQGA